MTPDSERFAAMEEQAFASCVHLDAIIIPCDTPPEYRCDPEDMLFLESSWLSE